MQFSDTAYMTILESNPMTTNNESIITILNMMV